MRIKQAVEKIPGGLMVVPLFLGAALNTLDQAHLAPIESLLQFLGASPTAAGHYEFFRIGGFTEALFKTGAPTLIGLFLFCAASQMNLRIGGRALKKGAALTTSKYLTGLLAGYLFAIFSDPFDGFLGLSSMAIIAAMTNSNGGMYAALTGQYGNRSDVGAIAVLSINDGPFLTLVSLGHLNAGTILDGTETLQEAGYRIFEKIIAVASGERTKSELLGMGDEEFAPWILGPTF